MKTWIIWLLTLNAQTGDLIDSHPEGVAVSLENCNKTLMEKGPQLVIDGKATVYVCHNIKQEAGRWI